MIYAPGLLVFGLALLTVVSSVHAQSMEAPTYSVGDTWTIKDGDAVREIKVLKVEDGNMEILGYLFRCPACIIRVDRNLTMLAVLDGGGKAADVTQIGFVPLGGQWQFYNFPLEPKKRWDFNATGFLRGMTRNYEVSNRVEGLEDVKTQAGTFKAYRIVRDWVLKPASSAFVNQRDFKWRSTTWFAPDVKFNVKTISTDASGQETELLSYSVK